MEEAGKLVDQLKLEHDPFVKARLMESLIKKHNLRVNMLAKALAIKPSYLCHYLRLNRIPDIVIDGFYNKSISLSHLFVISRLKGKEKIIQIYETILSKNLTVLQTEELTREMLYGIRTEGNMLTSEEKTKFLDSFDREVGVKINQSRIKSKLTIEIKGSLAKTTRILRTLLNRLTKTDS